MLRRHELKKKLRAVDLLKVRWLSHIVLLLLTTFCVHVPIHLESSLETSSDGCLTTLSPPPSLNSQNISHKIIENYFADLEMYLLSAAEKCLHENIFCSTWQQRLENISKLLNPPELIKITKTQEPLYLTILHSKNKVLAIVAINSYFIKKKYQASGVPSFLQDFLEKETRKNDLMNYTKTVYISADKKRYPWKAHNMSTASARTYLYVGLLNKNNKFISTAVDILPYVWRATREDGSLPLETRRGSRALRYSAQVLSDVSAILFFARSSFDPTSYKKNVENLSKSTQYVLATLKNNKTIETYASENKFPGPSLDYRYQDISSLRSRMAWLLLFQQISKNRGTISLEEKIDKSICASDDFAKRFECSAKISTLQDVLQQPLGFTLGINPKCAQIDHPPNI
jgi:hypothetical protein